MWQSPLRNSFSYRVKKLYSRIILILRSSNESMLCLLNISYTLLLSQNSFFDSHVMLRSCLNSSFLMAVPMWTTSCLIYFNLQDIIIWCETIIFILFLRLLALPLQWIKQQPTPCYHLLFFQQNTIEKLEHDITMAWRYCYYLHCFSNFARI